VSTFVNSLYITKYGIFKDKDLFFQDGKINLIFGDNETGKTTLMNLLRYQFYNFDKKHPAKRYDGVECEAVLTVKDESVTVKLSDNKREIIPQNTPLSNLSSYVSEDNFQKIYAFGQDELFNIKYKEIFGNEKNAILTATGIGVETNINDIFKNIDKSINNLYKPRGQKPAINKYISLIRKADKEIKEITLEMNRNKDILMHYEILKDTFNDKKEQLKANNTELGKLQKNMEPFETYCSIKRNQSEAETLGGKKLVDEKTFSQLKDIYNSIELSEHKLDDIEDSIKKLQMEYEIESQEYSPVDITKYEQILKKLQVSANEQDKISELEKNAKDAEKNLNKIYKNLNINYITPEILENPSAEKLININKEYKENNQELKYTKKLLNEKQEQIKDIDSNISELKEGMIYPPDEIEKDYESYKKLIDKLNEKNSQIEKNQDTITRLEKQIQDFDIKLFSLLQTKYPLYEEIKPFAPFMDKADQLMQHKKNIREYLDLTDKHGFSNNIFFTAGSLLFSLLLFTAFSSFFSKSPALLWTFIFIPLGMLADIIRYVSHKKKVNNKKSEINIQNKKLGITLDTLHDSLTQVEKILTNITKLQALEKDIQEKNISLTNLEQIYFEMVEKKNKNDQVHSTLQKIQLDTETLEKEAEAFAENLAYILDKYSFSNEDSANLYFSDFHQKNNKLKTLSFERKRLSQEITNLDNEYKKITSNLNSISEQFHDILKEHNQETISINNLDYLLFNKMQIQSFFYNIHIYKQKCGELEAMTDEIKNDMAEIGLSLNDIKTDIVEIENFIKTVNEKSQILKRLNIQIKDSQKDKHLLEQRINTQKEEYEKLLNEYKLENIDEAEKAYKINEKYADKCTELQTEKTVFKKRYGITFEDYEKMLAQQDYSTLEVQAEKLRKSIENLREEINELTAEKAKTEEIISGLSSKDQLQEAIKHKNNYTKRLKDNIQEYITLMTARTILENSVKKFEEESQPELLNIASNYLCEITSGRYTRIKIDYNNNLILTDNEGKQKYAFLLSAGTKDQLYIALRLAYIQMIDKDFRLPLIFDETIINFDDERQSSFIKTLDKLASDRQIIFFTCHSFIRDKFQKICNNLNVQELESAN